MKSFKEILQVHAPALLKRTKLPRHDPNYITQREAFDIYRSGRKATLKKEAPDLFARMHLPADHPDHISEMSAYAVLSRSKTWGWGKNHKSRRIKSPV
jgi:hypothetical protein